ncbi:MAG: 50S ribosomal protein L6 [Alphaproteobacteria bacterium]|jgi:large subunit ribosomal protein L6|nr:50S ribosomal protein L6 [Candidatus Jidaibacter sp.]
MSRIGKHPIELVQGVQATLANSELQVKGPKGELKFAVRNEVTVSVQDGKIVVQPKDDSKDARSLWGTTQRCIKAMVEGVTKGFTKILDINGVGYKAATSPKGDELRMFLGFSHSIVYIPPHGITIKCPKPTQIEVSGINKQVVGQVAAEIRAFKKPEPYNGKGIKYSDEVVRRKEAKK